MPIVQLVDLPFLSFADQVNETVTAGLYSVYKVKSVLKAGVDDNDFEAVETAPLQITVRLRSVKGGSPNES